MVEAPSARPGFDLNTAYEIEATLKKFREADGTQICRAAKLAMPIRRCGVR